MRNDRDYSVRADFPDFEVIQEHGFRALAQTLDDGRYIVITNIGGMDYPTYEDFMVCVYRNEDAFGDDPSTGLFGSFTSDDFADIDHALGAAEFCTEVLQ